MSTITDYILPLFKKTGNYLEIGCWRGSQHSQSLELERSGWTGICVDPFPMDFESRKCRVIAAAVSRDGAPRNFIKVSNDRRCGGDVSYFSGFKDSLVAHWPLIQEHCDYEEIAIDTITFKDIKAPKHINFMSIDVEGAELEIFRTIDFSMYKFDVIMYEHNGIQNGVSQILQANGYQLHMSLYAEAIYINNQFK